VVVNDFCGWFLEVSFGSSADRAFNVTCCFGLLVHLLCFVFFPTFDVEVVPAYVGPFVLPKFARHAFKAHGALSPICFGLALFFLGEVVF